MYSAEKCQEILDLWDIILDIIGCQSEWPWNIRELFWGRNLKYFERQVISSFVYVNGLHPEIFLRWIDLNGLCRDKAARDHIIWLLNDFDKDPSRWNLYAWNVDMNNYQYIDGRTRYYVPRNVRERQQ